MPDSHVRSHQKTCKKADVNLFCFLSAFVFFFLDACILLLTFLFVACVGWRSFCMFKFCFSGLCFNLEFFWMAFGSEESYTSIKNVQILQGNILTSGSARVISHRCPTPSTSERRGPTEDWMKSFFENNRAYFEKQGLAQKLKKQDMRGPVYFRERK